MALFDRPQFMRLRWSDYSLDYKLFFIWEASLFAAIIVAQNHVFDTLNDTTYYGSALGWLALLTLTAFVHRARQNWQWPGISSLGVASMAQTCI